jgi:K+-transporting ATPase c subunit
MGTLSPHFVRKRLETRDSSVEIGNNRYLFIDADAFHGRRSFELRKPATSTSSESNTAKDNPKTTEMISKSVDHLSSSSSSSHKIDASSSNDTNLKTAASTAKRKKPKFASSKQFKKPKSSVFNK